MVCFDKNTHEILDSWALFFDFVRNKKLREKTTFAIFKPRLLPPLYGDKNLKFEKGKRHPKFTFYTYQMFFIIFLTSISWS